MSTVIQESYRWKETSPGAYSRGLGFCESYLVRVSELSQPHDEKCIYASVSFNCHETLSAASIEEAGRQAWMAMRYRHPSIACTVNWAEKKFEYRSPVSDNEVESWLSKTFIVTNLGTQSIIRKAENKPLATLYLNPKSQTLLLQTSHWRFDGRGILLFFDAFLDALTNPGPQSITFGDEYVHLSLPFDAVAYFPDPSPEDAAAEMDTLVDSFLAALPSLGLEPQDNVEGQWLGSDAVRMSFSRDETTALIKGIKKANVTVTQAVQAATYMAIPAVSSNHDQNQGSNGKIASMTIVDFRPWCGEHAIQTPVSCYFGAIMTIIEPGKFDHITQQLGELWKKWVRTDLFKSGIAQFRERFLPITSQPMPFVPSTPFVTSMGIAGSYLKKEYGNSDKNLTVTDYCISDERVGRELVVFLWTFNDKLEINLAYNYGYLDRAFVENFGETLKRELYQGLHLS
jgi:hypothetical protein